MALVLIDTVDIPTAGTRVQLSTLANSVVSVTFKARNGNTGSIYIGTSNVASTKGFELRTNESLVFNFVAKVVSVPMSTWYADTATNGNDVDIAAMLL